MSVVVEDLVVRYGEFTAVDGLSLQAQPGEVLAILGPNGAGKTTTVETLEGFHEPSGGAVRVLGLDPRRNHGELVPRIGVMLQAGGLYSGIRPLEALELFASYYPNPLDPAGLLERVGLGAQVRTSWRSLSGGEQQRLSLALALVGRPEVVFLDEPTSGVDPTGRRTIRDLIGELATDGVCVLVTTHELDEAERLADRVVIVDHGRAVADGTLAELTATDAAEVRFAAGAGLDTAALTTALGVPVQAVGSGEYVVHATGDPRLVARLTAWLAERDLELADLRVGRQRLADVFDRLTSDDETTGIDKAESGERRRRRRRR